MKSYKHSGAFGDLIYSLALAKYFGPGKFYLHLNQINWIGQYYYGNQPNPIHQGRLKDSDYEFMRDFMLAQSYITEFNILDTTAEITHNLDKFRPLFVGHPGNYVDIYCWAFGIKDERILTNLRNNAWLSVPKTKQIDQRSVVINRTGRWLPNELSTQWRQWQEQGYESRSVFVGMPEEYDAFIKVTGWNIPGYTAETMLDLAALIAGSEEFIGNQSVALSLAIGLGKKFNCEYRRDLPLARNECYFPDHPQGFYF